MFNKANNRRNDSNEYANNAEEIQLEYLQTSSRSSSKQSSASRGASGSRSGYEAVPDVHAWAAGGGGGNNSRNTSRTSSKQRMYSEGFHEKAGPSPGVMSEGSTNASQILNNSDLNTPRDSRRAPLLGGSNSGDIVELTSFEAERKTGRGSGVSLESSDQGKNDKSGFFCTEIGDNDHDHSMSIRRAINNLDNNKFNPGPVSRRRPRQSVVSFDRNGDLVENMETRMSTRKVAIPGQVANAKESGRALFLPKKESDAHYKKHRNYGNLDDEDSNEYVISMSAIQSSRRPNLDSNLDPLVQLQLKRDGPWFESPIQMIQIEIVHVLYLLLITRCISV
jgi:hypothetical protein